MSKVALLGLGKYQKEQSHEIWWHLPRYNFFKVCRQYFKLVVDAVQSMTFQKRLYHFKEQSLRKGKKPSESNIHIIGKVSANLMKRLENFRAIYSVLLSFQKVCEFSICVENLLFTAPIKLSWKALTLIRVGFSVNLQGGRGWNQYNAFFDLS